MSNKVPLAIHDYRHGYPELPKHPVPKEDVTAHSSPIFHPPKSQSSLQPMLPEPIPEIESSSKFRKFILYQLLLKNHIWSLIFWIFYNLIFVSSGETIAQGRNWRSPEWGWNTTIPPTSVIDVVPTSVEGNQ